MKKIIKEYFTFNKRERNGILVLLSIIIIFSIALMFSDLFVSSSRTDFTQYEKEIDTFYLTQKQFRDSINITNKSHFNSLAKDSVSAKNILFKFNPNKLPAQQWLSLGLSSKQIKTIQNYENKGGRFYKKEDLKKMYCISEKQYNVLSPYIDIPDNKPLPSKILLYEKPILSIELNSADSIQLLKLKGIGPAFAKRIIKYRDLLGGFYNTKQLLQVYGLDQEKYQSILSHISLDASKVKKINVNTCTPAELKHPYVNFNIANSIVNYRKKHGTFNDLSEIKKIDLVDDELYLKIVPYLKINEF